MLETSALQAGTPGAAPPASGFETRSMRRSRTVSARRASSGLLRALGVLLTISVSGVLLTAAGLLFFLHLSVQPVLTGSMRPTFDPGSVVISRTIPVTAIRPGMVVIFVPPGHSASYAHRIVSVTGTAQHPVLTTKGDANPGADPWHARINSTEIQQVIWSVPWLGRVMVAVHGPTLKAVLIGLAGLLVAITGARSILQPRSRGPRRHLPPRTA